jgi:hypothetical protein
MPKPQNKQELLDVIADERRKLLKALDMLTDAQMEMGGACGEWAVKDILSHLTDWEQRGLRWYRAGLKGEVSPIPDADYNWRELPALNDAIYQKYRDRPLAEVRQAFEDSFDETMAALDGMTEEALFTPNTYDWTGKHLLATYVNANTASHYRWAAKLIRKFARSLA